jgi:glutamate synthase (NADPH/NADH) small chain
MNLRKLGMPPAKKLPRHHIPERTAGERTKDFNEVPTGYTAEMAVAEASRCLQCKKAFCVDGCPVCIDIPAFIKLIHEGRFMEAALKLKEETALPAVCGRVCPQETQCENTCVLAKTGEPVAIGNLERFAADYERQRGAAPPPKGAPTGSSIAVVGAGPAGLTAAGELARMGHRVVAFEALHEPGGVLMYGIPEFRLPKEIVKAEADGLKQLGVEFRMDFPVGMAQTIDELFEEGFDAIFVGTGAGLPQFLGVPGENFVGVLSANEYLTRVNLMRGWKRDGRTPVLIGKHTVVFGGGNVAMDSARTALRMGGGPVTVSYRRSMAEMPARVEEVRHAGEEGIHFEILSAPLEILGDEKGRVKAVKSIRMQLGEPDSSGRRRPVPIPGSEYTLETDLIVVAIGNKPNPMIMKTTRELETTSWGGLKADPETGATSVSGVYAAGDIVTGAATVIEAMGAAKNAAKAIHDFLQRGGRKGRSRETSAA